MVAIPSFKRITLPLSTVVAAGGATLVALAFLVMPGGLLERLVSASGFPSILAAAEPPLGFTARIGLALVGGAVAAGFLWYGTYLAVGVRTVGFGGGAPGASAVRRATAYPDAPRAPLLANRDLGKPFLDVRADSGIDLGPAAEIDFDPPAEQPLPLDLDRPMAAYDPRALLAEPLPPPLPVTPMPRPAPALRVEASAPESVREARSLRYDPNTISTAHRAPLRADPPAPVRPPRDATIRDLLQRLEKSVAKDTRGPVQAASLSAALGDLRRMALDRR